MELEVGGIYEGKVTGITKFGAFVSFEGGKSGLVHISEVANSFVSDVGEHVKMGQMVKVKVLSITNDGKINLSLKRVEAEQARTEENPAPRRSPAPVKQEKYVMAPVSPEVVNENSGSVDFEDRLKKFMQESDSRIAGNRLYSDRSRGRRRKG